MKDGSTREGALLGLLLCGGQPKQFNLLTNNKTFSSKAATGFKFNIISGYSPAQLGAVHILRNMG